MSYLTIRQHSLKLGVFMIFSIKDIGNTSIIYIQAKSFSLSECLLISKTIIKLAKRKNRYIVLNLNYSLAINNLFLEMLLFSWRFCDRNNCIISLSGINPDTLCIFYLLKLDKYFEIYDNSHEAILRKNRLVKRRLKVV